VLESCALGIDEPKVTYVLVEMPKLLEHDNFPENYMTDPDQKIVWQFTFEFLPHQS